MTPKEIFLIDNKTGKTFVLQYTEEKTFNTMRTRCYQWEREGRIGVIDVRDAEYPLIKA